MKNLLHFYLLLCVWIYTAPAAQAQWNTTWQYVHPKPSISEIAAVGASASGAVAMAGGRGFAVWANNQWQGGSQEIYGTVNDMLLLNEQTALASTSRGIYRSTDGGITWQYINYGPYGGIWGFHCNELQTLPDGTVLASCSDYLRSYVYRSIDSGETWEYKFFEIDEEVAESIAFIDTIYGFVAGQMNHLLKTTDTGNTWQTLLVPTAGDAFIRDVHFFNTQKGLCVAENGNIAITYDGGNTWQSAADFAGMRFYKMVFKNELSGFAFAKDSNDNIHLFKTNNGGSYWFEVDNTLQLSDISFADYGNAVMYGSNNTDVYRSFDDATSWNNISQRNAYGTVREMQFLNPSLGYAIIGDGIYGSSDGGATWQQQYQGEAADSLRLLQFLNPLLGYAYADNSKILRTFDGGLTWINTDEYIESETGNYTEVNNLHFFSRKKGKLYLTSLNAQGIPIGELFETEDGGFVWKKVFGGTQFIRFKKLFWRSEQEVFATQQDGAKLFHSTDGGKTWNAVWQSNDFLNILDLSFVGDNYIYGSGKACIAKSENGGSTWQAAPSYLNFANIEFFDKDKGYILNHLGNVEYNNGLILTEEWQGWSVIKSLPQANHILLVNPNRLLVYGDNAVIIRAEIENKAYTDFDYTYIPECEGATLQLSYFENYPYTQNFYWTIDGDTVGYEKKLNYFFSEEKTYRVALHTYSDAYGTLSRSKDIYISPRSPEIIPSGDLMACSQSGAAITLSAQPVWYNSVEWSQGSSSPTITISDAATPYSAIFYSNYCGTQTDSIVAPFRALPEVALNAADTVCVQGALQLQASGAGTFQWQFPTTQILNDSTAVVVTPASGNYPASYTVQITDAYGCTATATATVYEGNAAAQVSLSASASTVCPNDTIIIEAQGGTQVQWLFPHQLINSNTVAYYTGNAPSFPDTLEAFVTDNQACAALATLTLQADDLKKIRGHIYTSDNEPLSNATLYLYAAGSLGQAADTTVSDAGGYYELTTYSSEPFAQYVVYAAPDHNLYPYQIGTYYNGNNTTGVPHNSMVINKATAFCNPQLDIDFKTLPRTLLGDGYINGFVHYENGNAAGAVPLLLMDGDIVAAYAITDAQGLFEMTSVPLKTLQMWADRPLIPNTLLAPALPFSAQMPVMLNTSFTLHNTYLSLDYVIGLEEENQQQNTPHCAAGYDAFNGNIYIQGVLPQNFTANLLNLEGKTLHSWRGTAADNTALLTLPVALSSGVYYIQWQQDARQQTFKLLVW